MTEALRALHAARRRLAAAMPEPTERQREALDELDQAIARLEHHDLTHIPFGGDE